MTSDTEVPEARKGAVFPVLWVEEVFEIFDANNLAICFLSVIKLPFSCKWLTKEERFLPFILQIAFQTFWLVVLEFSFEQKLLQDVFVCFLTTNRDIARTRL